MASSPGMLVCFGSGETAPEARQVYEYVMQRIPPPIRAAVLETPAGFELNSAMVAGRLAEFLRTHLPNYRPEVVVVPARRRGTPESPDSPEVVAPLERANLLLLGPSSPTYAIRQLTGSRAWFILQARHRLGHPVVLASAALIAASRYALPVYEIYKVGEDLHWKTGLDLLGPYGAEIAFIPHWNNTDGGNELDTSRCFMGVPRFAQLLELLPPGVTVVGIDEHTALILDFEHSEGRVMGLGGVTIRREGVEQSFPARTTFPLAELGVTRQPAPSEGLPPEIWERVSTAEAPAQEPELEPPADVRVLVERRRRAREERDWATADQLREEILERGWQVIDTPAGPRLVPLHRP